MKTFTLDSYNGKLNPDIEWIEKQTREDLRKVVECFITNCIKNDVEVTSASGLFYEMVMQELTMIRSKQVFELNKNVIKKFISLGN